LVGCKTEQGRSGINLFLMKEQLLKYGFTESQYGWIQLKKNGWTFDYSPIDNYIWIYSPHCADDEGINLRNLTYEKTIALIEFISEYK